MLQEKLFHQFLHAMLIATQLLGLWPYNHNFDDRSFRPSKYFYVYSMVIFTIINVGYFVYFQNLYSNYILIFKSGGARTTIMYGVVSISIVTLLTYPIQLAGWTSLNSIFVKGKCLMQNLNGTIAMGRVNYSKELLQFATKTFAIRAFQIYLSITNMRDDPMSMIFGFIMPDLIITLMASTFHGILLIIHVYLKQINESIRNVTDSADELHRSDKNCLEKLETFCGFSDRLNELLMYRCRILDLMRRSCRQFSFHSNGWMVHRVCITFIQLFVIYIMIVAVVHHKSKHHLNTLCITVAQVVLTVAELLFLTKTCNGVNHEVKTLICAELLPALRLI